jgi:hypothetical protein
LRPRNNHNGIFSAKVRCVGEALASAPTYWRDTRGSSNVPYINREDLRIIINYTLGAFD